MVIFWKPNKGKVLKPSKINPWKTSMVKPAKAFYGDSDGDKVMNMFDCQPHNKKKQGKEHEEEYDYMSPREREAVEKEFAKEKSRYLKSKGLKEED